MSNPNKNKNSKLAQNDKRKHKNIRRRYFGFFWLGIIIAMVSMVLVFLLASWGVFGPMPDVKELETPDIYVASEIISSDGVVMDKYEREKRIPLTYEELSPDLVNALISKEDVRFYEHSGIDFKRTASAFAHLGTKGGASTITQQLSKLLFTNAEKGKSNRILQKVKENIIAVRLERLYTKNEIITMYFNKFNFTHGAYGIEMASKIYFNKSAKDLDLGESATLVAMLQKPSGYNPVSNPEDAIKGRDGVLNQMRKYGKISDAQENEFKGKPVAIDYQPSHSTETAYSSYYKHFLKSEIEGYLSDYEKKTGKKYNLYKDGLKISVTLNSHMQKYAEEAIRKRLKTVIQPNFNRRVKYGKYPYTASMSQSFYDTLIARSVRQTDRYKKGRDAGKSWKEIMKEMETPTRLEIFDWEKGVVDTLMSPLDSLKYHKTIARAGFMAMETHSGQIKSWVGGVDWNFFKYDMVKTGRRQVGSTFKPFVYATAITDLGYTPCTSVSNATYRNGSYVVPGGGGMIALRDALAYSKNTVALRLIEAAGVDRVINMARELGVTSKIERNNTIALGSGDITIYEMIGAYSTFANYGTYTRPEIIWRIEDNKGKVIKENVPYTREVMNELYSYAMIDMMKGVTTRGTAKAMRGMGIKGDVAGKTGTTQNNSDCWFIGITPNLAAGVWVGFEDRFSRNYSVGGVVAMPIWVDFMKKVYADKTLDYSPDDKFEKPEEVEEAGGFSCEMLMGASSDEDLYTIGEILSGADRPDTGPSVYVPTDRSINSKLSAEDSIKDLFKEEDIPDEETPDEVQSNEEAVEPN